MKVKMFANDNLMELESIINAYLLTVSPVDFVDIKYASTQWSFEAMVITRH